MNKLTTKNVLVYVLVFVLGGLATFAVLTAGDGAFYQGRLNKALLKRAGIQQPVQLRETVTRAPRIPKITSRTLRLKGTTWTLFNTKERALDSCSNADQESLNALAVDIAEECGSEVAPEDSDLDTILEFMSKVCADEHKTTLGSYALQDIASSVYQNCEKGSSTDLLESIDESEAEDIPVAEEDTIELDESDAEEEDIIEEDTIELDESDAEEEDIIEEGTIEKE